MGPMTRGNVSSLILKHTRLAKASEMTTAEWCAQGLSLGSDYVGTLPAPFSCAIRTQNPEAG